jgi:hypothetical protein
LVPGRHLPEFTYTGATYDVDASLARGWVDELVEANALTERARAVALARGYPLKCTDNRSIAEAVSAYLADSVLEGA